MEHAVDVRQVELSGVPLTENVAARDVVWAEAGAMTDAVIV